MYPAATPTALRQTIELWFGDREVSSDKDFGRYFYRTLDRDLKHYLQNLRIEAGVSDYDWLVQDYRERQSYFHTIGEDGKEVSTTGSIADGGTISDAGERKNTGTQTNVRDDDRTVTRDTTDTNSKSGSLGIEKTGTVSVDHSGTITDNETHSITTGGSTQDVTDEKTLEKTTPMSASYPAGTGQTPGFALDWQFPSGQRETYTDNTGSTSGTDSGTSQNARALDYGDVTTNDLQDTHTSSESGTQTHTGTIDYADDETRTRTDNLTQTDSNTRTIATTRTQTGGQQTEGTDERENLTQEIYTGRSYDVATLLTKAVNYIWTTDAWDTLRRSLELCFVSVYDW